MKLSYITSKKSVIASDKPSSSYEQPSADLIKWPLLKSHEKPSHVSQFTKHISSFTLEGGALLKI